jgi:mannitol-specific phosphotransferase system IIBC component
MFDLSSLSNGIKFFDFVILILVIIYSTIAFVSWKHQPKKERDIKERELGIRAIGRSLAIFTTSSSILLTAVGLISKLNFPTGSIPNEIFTQLIIAGFFFLLSIVFGVISSTYILNHVHHKQSVVENFHVMGFAITQFGFTIAGSCFLLITFFLF